jgi:hypothetical protein
MSEPRCTTTFRHASLVALGTAAWLSASSLAPPRAQAYLDGRTFEDDAVNGGGGGRLFTGAPGDGYDCSVCHRGGAPLALTVEGIPSEGWEPGRTYVLAIPFPEGARNVGAVIEVADERGRGAGTLEGLAAGELTAEDLCRGDAPAAHGVEAEARTVARADVCGAQRLAVRWTAPSTPVTSLRVFASVVAADDSGDPSGDATGRSASALRARGEPALEGGRLTAGCAVHGGSSASRWTLVTMLALTLAARRRRTRASR